jgi:hypothetical protein
MFRPRTVAAAAIVLAYPLITLAQPGPDGIDWVTIGAPNNPAYHGPDPFGYVTGRGSVGYEYRLARTETTTAQWLEFYNAALARPDPLPWAVPGFTPLRWGAVRDTTYTGPGVKYRLSAEPDAAMRPAYSVPWRVAAMFANWMHNDKSSDRAAFLSGAYDVSTFGDNPDGTFTDQATRSPGARYWVPSLDEWIKAAHWSPTNTTNDGWYQYSNGSDISLTYGPPPAFGGDGTGQANAGFILPAFGEYRIPLGSYPQTPSIRGFLDIAGCASEWTEEVFDGRYRRYDGSRAGGMPGGDLLYGLAAQTPSSLAGDFGLRLASSVASPGIGGIFLVSLCVLRGRSRTRKPFQGRTSCRPVDYFPPR